MLEDETFSDLYRKLSDSTNSSFAFGEPYTDVKIIHKILRSLLKRFHSKVTSLEDSKDLDNMKVEELVGSLITYKMKLKPKKKDRKISLKTKVKNKADTINETLPDETMALLAQNFNRFIKKNFGGKK